MPVVSKNPFVAILSLSPFIFHDISVSTFEEKQTQYLHGYFNTNTKNATTYAQLVKISFSKVFPIQSLNY